MRPNRFVPAITLSAILAFAVPLGACSTIAAGVTNVAATVAGPAPNQATTLAQALQFATLATDAADVAVRSGKLSKPVLVEVGALSDSVHVALVKLEEANAAGQSLSFAAFNAALSAYNVYMTAHPA